MQSWGPRGGYVEVRTGEKEAALPQLQLPQEQASARCRAAAGAEVMWFAALSAAPSIRLRPPNICSGLSFLLYEAGSGHLCLRVLF